VCRADFGRRHDPHVERGSDNGTGMSREELLRFFSTLGEGARRIALGV
jgi:hypothetical protein